VIDSADVKRALRPNTRLLSLMMANNETGVLQPLEEIGRIAAEAGVCFHTDAVQAAAKLPIDVKRIGCHALTISGHKIHAPQGTGALYVKKGTKIRPLLHGGRHERSRRAGTENVPGIVGLGKAAELAKQGLDRGDDKTMSALRDRLQQGILAQVEDAGVNGDGAPRVPNTTNIHFDFIEGESLVIALDLKGLAVSTGAACSSGAIEPSHVLIAMGMKPEQARASIRFSLGKQTTPEDIEFALALVPETVARLRELSPKYTKQTVRT
jgi:cysteine desulfurase